MEKFDVIVVGAGAAGMFCAAQAGQRGYRVLLLDNGKKAGRKILMSGGGRCNFTNLNSTPAAYLSGNPHFCKSALARYTQWDFLGLVNDYRIAWHEKNLGQLFCDDSAQQIVAMLISECQRADVTFRFRSEIIAVVHSSSQYQIKLNSGTVQAPKLVIASGGLSLPGLGATPFGYQLAKQFNLNIIPTRAALVPFTLQTSLLNHLQVLSGVSLPAMITAADGTQFKEALLFTHRGLSGPAVLQISSYWHPGEFITIDLSPVQEIAAFIDTQRRRHPNQSLKNTLAKVLPKRLTEVLQSLDQIPDITLKQLNCPQQKQLSAMLHHWRIQPGGTEGYRTAEVTLGGIDTTQLSSKTMEVRHVPGLYFIGEVVDVTGWLGGYNFQWAWSSAWACAQSL